MMANDWQSKYFYVGYFSEGLARVNVGGKYVQSGEDEDLGSSVGLVEGGQWGFVDETGKEVIPPKYDWVDHFSEGLAAVRLNGLSGFFNEQGKEVIPPKYDMVIDFSEHLARFKRNRKEGFVDETGKEVIPPKYDHTGVFSKVLAAGELYVREGFVDKTGNEYWDMTEDQAREQMKKR